MHTRKSRGLEQFCSSLEDRPGLTILDLAGANQDTISFITSHGHRLYSDDFLLQMDECFGREDFYANQADAQKASQFLDSALNFADGQFDGVLVWDALQFVAAPLLEAVVTRLWAISRPGSYLLALFHSDERVETMPTYAFRVADAGTIRLAERGRRRPAQAFNNRSLERLFEQFESVKFFLTRDHLREVVVRR